ncbi:immunity 17 family protein [Dysgonomonas termitidis]|jgi:hypothetical protein|uniref:Immunity 17 family protein n=1 Tax=Dysgonomonas termitidis TaxID=1516126 RepID=A0ABV9KZR6_9BACT
MDNLKDTIQDYYDQHPVILPLFCIAIGIFLLLACIFDWNWIFGDVNTTTYNLKKIDGLVNMFGRKTARFLTAISAVFLIVLGIGLAIMILY